MLILGITSKDKGAQLEALVHTELETQGYVDVHSNVVGAGGNELDVTGKRVVDVISASHVVPLLCEAKAYKDPVDMPTWQKFLGKLFIERSQRPSTLGILIALNGVNGNVRGSYDSLVGKNEGIIILDGSQLIGRAREAGEVVTEAQARQAAEAGFRRKVFHMETVYYGGGYFWVTWWNHEDYSIVDAHGNRLLAHEVENLRKPLEASVAGRLLATDEAQAQAEARHNMKIGLISRLLKGERVVLEDSSTDAEKEVFTSLAEERYSRLDGEQLHLLSADDLDAVGISRFFGSLVEGPVSVRHLDFMVGMHHDPYVQRLIDTLPEHQAGFTLPEDDELSLRALAPLFPSVWVLLARPIEMITIHRTESPELADSAIAIADQNTFWGVIINAVREDFTNISLRGFLYDYLDVADLDETREITVKSKQAVIGMMKSTTRIAIRQLSEEFSGEEGTRHLLVYMLPTAAEPWDDAHPQPIPLDRVPGNEA